jgi:hypothetical protein
MDSIKGLARGDAATTEKVSMWIDLVKKVALLVRNFPRIRPPRTAPRHPHAGQRRGDHAAPGRGPGWGGAYGRRGLGIRGLGKRVPTASAPGHPIRTNDTWVCALAPVPQRNLFSTPGTGTTTISPRSSRFEKVLRSRRLAPHHYQHQCARSDQLRQCVLQKRAGQRLAVSFVTCCQRP